MEKKIAELEKEVASKQNELNALYSDMDGVYQSNEQSVEAQKKLEVQIKKQEENILAQGKQEIQLRVELAEKSRVLEDLEIRSKQISARLMSLEEMKV